MLRPFGLFGLTCEANVAWEERERRPGCGLCCRKHAGATGLSPGLGRGGPRKIAATVRAPSGRRMVRPSYPAIALRAFGTVSFGETLYQACSMCPCWSIKKDERMMPQYFLP